MATSIFGAMQATEGCAPPLYKTFAVNNKVEIPLSELKDAMVKIIRVQNNRYDLAMIKNKQGKIVVFQLRCTHAENEITYSGKGFDCSLHGSKFNLEGQPVKGPAELNLTRYQTIIGDSTIVVLLS